MKFTVSEPVMQIKAYEPGKPLKEVEREYNIKDAVKLASNENPFGYSPDVKKAVERLLDQMNRYPESSAPELCAVLSEKFGVGISNIVIGNGSDDIIALLAHAFLNQGDEALMPLPSFLMYEISVKTAKGKPVMVPLTDFTTNLDGILSAIGERTRMIFVTNPFNPTGAVITTAEFERFAARVPDDVLIIVDEAYIEFVREDTVFNSLDRPLFDPRVVTLRTFSKAYGLAGFRVGYGIMDEQVAGILHRIRQPFNVNSLAQAAAVAAVSDTQFLSNCIENTHRELDFLIEKLTNMGLTVLPTQSNFLMTDVGTDASVVFEAMLRQGVVVRSMKSYGFENWLRINAGTRKENEKFIAALKQVLNR